MTFAKILASAAAVSLATAPVLAQAAAQPVPARDGAAVEDAEHLRGGFIVPLLALVAVVLGILAATGGDDDELPTSP